MRYFAIPMLFVLLLSLPSGAAWAEPCGQTNCDDVACESDDCLEVVTVSHLGGDGVVAGDGEVEDPFVDEGVFEGATESFASAPTSFAPNMIGDFLNAGAGNVICGEDSSYDDPLCVSAPSPSAYRFKVAEDNSVFPKCRIILNYNRYDDALRILDIDGNGDTITDKRTIDRFVVGIEKAFWDKRASVQVHLPIFSGTDYYNATDPDLFGVNTGNVGNLQLTGKFVLLRNCYSAVSAGAAVTIPTGYDIHGSIGGNPFSIDNESVHIMPFLGYYRSLACDRAWLQAFLQLDMDVNGNTVTYDGFSGRGQDQNLLYADASLGYWLFENQCCDARVRGIASILEFHYTTSVQSADIVSLAGDDFVYGNVLGNVDIATITAGAQFQFARSDARIGFAVPVGTTTDTVNGISINNRPFDWEFMVQYNIGY